MPFIVPLFNREMTHAMQFICMLLMIMLKAIIAIGDFHTLLGRFGADLGIM